jgi:hypothetical protein
VWRLSMRPRSTGHMHNGFRQKVARYAFVALIVQIPFELRYTLLGLTNLQWTFVALAALSAPDLLAHTKDITRNRFLQVLTLFVCIQSPRDFCSSLLQHVGANRSVERYLTDGLLRHSQLQCMRL